MNEQITTAKVGRPNVGLETLELWINADKDNKVIIQEMNMKRAFESYFEPWASENNCRLSYPSFNNVAKTYLEKNNLTNPYVRGLRNNGRSTLMSKELKEEKLDLRYREKFEMIHTYTEMLKEGYINSLRIYGTSGVGKDFNVEKVLGKQAHYFKGGLKGTYELVKILYMYRKDCILVFSDFDSVFKTVEQKNILKTALEDIKSRTITWIDSTKRTKRDSIPSQFEFTSGIIFISNQKRFDDAIDSRSIAVKIDMNTIQTLDWIKYNLEGFMPKIPMSLKEEVWDYLYSIRSSLRKMDFRQFKFCVATKIGQPDKWKEWIKIQMK